MNQRKEGRERLFHILVQTWKTMFFASGLKTNWVDVSVVALSILKAIAYKDLVLLFFVVEYLCVNDTF